MTESRSAKDNLAGGGPSWKKRRDAQDLVIRQHRLTGALRIMVFNGAQNIHMFALGHLAKLVDINGGKHSTPHLAARFVNGLKRHLVSS